MIEGRGLHFAFGADPTLEDIDLTAPDGQVVGLIGPNGSGKTTLLRNLYAALTPDVGHVEVDGRPLADLKPREVARRMAVVVQESDGELPLSVQEMVVLGRLPHRGSFQGPSDDDHRIASDALRRVGAAHLAGRTITQLSGGERQRVLIARALAQEASHLLLDEPTNHLDIRFQHEVLQLVRSLAVTTVIVLHDLNLAARYCDEVVLLEEGRVAAAGSADQVLRPEVLEPVYRIGVERLATGGLIQLLFHPLDAADHADAAARSAAAAASTNA